MFTEDAVLLDAKRYRWIRSKARAEKDSYGAYIELPSFHNKATAFLKGSTSKHLDAAIDKAMKSSK